LVESLIAKQKESAEAAKKQQEMADKAAKKIKELKSLSIKDLEKQVKKKGLDVSGKKEDLVAALYEQSALEDAVEARKTELKQMDVQELGKLLLTKGLKAGKQKKAMVQTMLEHDAKRREELRTYEAKVEELAVKKKEEFQSKTGAELKDMLTAKGLPAGVGKEERIQRLIEAAKKDGEIDKCFVHAARDARHRELQAMEKKDLLSLCQDAGTDPLVKEVLVERILSYEEDAGQPISKKARSSR